MTPATKLQKIPHESGELSAFFSLPFVAQPPNHLVHASPYWTVPATGGFDEGRKTGRALAEVFLKYLREDRHYDPCRLTRIIESFMVRFEQEGGQAMVNRPLKEQSDSFASLQGQYCGFFSTLSYWLVDAACLLGYPGEEPTQHPQSYRSEQLGQEIRQQRESVSRWRKERLQPAPRSHTTVSTLYRDYESWSEEHQEEPCPGERFGRFLAEIHIRVFREDGSLTIHGHVPACRSTPRRSTAYADLPVPVQSAA